MQRRNFLRNLLISGIAVAVMPSLILQKNDDDLLDELVEKGESVMYKSFNLRRDHWFTDKNKKIFISNCTFKSNRSLLHFLYNENVVVTNCVFNATGIVYPKISYGKS